MADLANQTLLSNQALVSGGLEAWKQQLDIGMRIVEALVETSTHLSEMQLKAATEAHAETVAAQRSIAKASDPGEVLRIVADWQRHNAEHCGCYWRDAFQASLEANKNLMKCFQQRV